MKIYNVVYSETGNFVLKDVLTASSYSNRKKALAALLNTVEETEKRFKEEDSDAFVLTSRLVRTRTFEIGSWYGGKTQAVATISLIESELK